MVNWRTIFPRHQTSLSGNLLKCLLERGSLMIRLERLAPQKMVLTLKTQAWKKPHIDEAGLLSQRNGEYIFLREVILSCSGQAWIYARTAIPPRTLFDTRQLAHWGNKPLGYYLFSNRSIRRGAMQIAMIDATNNPYEQDHKNALHECEPCKRKSLWARRSFFHIRKKPLLLTEVFLPAALSCLDSRRR